MLSARETIGAHRRRSVLVAVIGPLTLAVFTHVTLASAQAPATFEVASVKANTSGANQVTINFQGGVTLINVPLRAIVQLAYNINTPSRIIGHPEWTNVERFDIQARPPEGMATTAQMGAMLRTLLVERFRLVAQMEKRESQAYALVKARTDGRLGPHLKAATAACVGPRGEPNPLAIQCAGPGSVPGATRFAGVPMPQLAALISLIVGRPVTDRTGLAGAYDLELRFSGDPAPGAPLPDASAPSIYTALEEQLGLKLDAERDVVEVLVIDRIERPADN